MDYSYILRRGQLWFCTCMIGVPGSGVLLCNSDAFLSFSSLIMITSVMTDLERTWVKAYSHGFDDSSRKDLYYKWLLDESPNPWLKDFLDKSSHLWSSPGLRVRGMHQTCRAGRQSRETQSCRCRIFIWPFWEYVNSPQHDLSSPH